MQRRPFVNPDGACASVPVSSSAAAACSIVQCARCHSGQLAPTNVPSSGWLCYACGSTSLWSISPRASAPPVAAPLQIPLDRLSVASALNDIEAIDTDSIGRALDAIQDTLEAATGRFRRLAADLDAGADSGVVAEQFRRAYRDGLLGRLAGQVCRQAVAAASVSQDHGVESAAASNNSAEVAGHRRPTSSSSSSEIIDLTVEPQQHTSAAAASTSKGQSNFKSATVVVQPHFVGAFNSVARSLARQSTGWRPEEAEEEEERRPALSALNAPTSSSFVSPTANSSVLCRNTFGRASTRGSRRPRWPYDDGLDQ